MFPSFTSLYQICQLLYLSTFITVVDELELFLCKKTPLSHYYLIISFSMFMLMLFLLQQHLIQQLSQILLDRTRTGKSLTQVCFLFFLNNCDWSFDCDFWGFFTYIFLAFHCKNSTHSPLQTVWPLCPTLSMLFRAFTFKCTMMMGCFFYVRETKACKVLFIF